MKANVMIGIDVELLTLVDTSAKEKGVTRPALIRAAVAAYLGVSHEEAAPRESKPAVVKPKRVPRPYRVYLTGGGYAGSFATAEEAAAAREKAMLAQRAAKAKTMYLQVSMEYVHGKECAARADWVEKPLPDDMDQGDGFKEYALIAVTAYKHHHARFRPWSERAYPMKLCPVYGRRPLEGYMKCIEALAEEQRVKGDHIEITYSGI